MARRRPIKPNGRVLPPVHPNAGIRASYKRRLDRLIADMAASVEYWLKAAYRANAPKMAMDATPATELQKAIDKLSKGWTKRIDDMAPELAAYFATAVTKRSDAALKAILREAGITVRFRMTTGMRDVFEATVQENVGLIKSIPQQYLGEVQGLVMRSVAAGRDLKFLTRELRTRYGITQRRAAFIALDQNNKATSALQRARQTELGIEQGVWMHSHAGKEPRPTHLANDGKVFSITEGWYDPDPKVRRRIWPGELINCFPGSTRIKFAGFVEKAFRHWFDGELTILKTATGKTLHATPNHPILTPHGWRPAGSLDEGDYIVEIANKRIGIIMPKGHKDHGAPLISDVFDAVAKAGHARSEVSLRDQFHGDGSAHGYVDVVDATRPLLFNLQPALAEGISDHSFANTDKSIFGRGALDEFGNRYLRPPSGVVSGRGKSGPADGTLALHPNSIGIASPTSGSADGQDASHDGVARDAMKSRQGQDALSCLMPATQVTRLTQVDRSSFNGHVFNLQTEAGLYVAEGILVSNCRCTWRPVVKGFS